MCFWAGAKNQNLSFSVLCGTFAVIFAGPFLRRLRQHTYWDLFGRYWQIAHHMGFEGTIMGQHPFGWPTLKDVNCHI